MSDPIKKLNDATVLDQLDGKWAQITGLLLHKFAKRGEPVTFTTQEMEQMNLDWPEGTIVACIAGYDTLSFKLVTPEEAARLAAHNKTQAGTS